MASALLAGEAESLFLVASYLPWSSRLRVLPRLSAEFQGHLREESTYWRWLCQCLCEEARLYMPAPDADVRLLAGGGRWRAFLLELWPLRHRFAGAASGPPAPAEAREECRLAAYCRLRPPRGEPARGSAVPVKLMPVSQRLALLRQAHPELSQKQAMQRLLQQDSAAAGGPDPGAPASVASGFTSSVLSVTPGDAGSVLTVSPGIGIRGWDFDHVFGDTATQDDLYRRCGLRLAVDLLNGGSGALVVYGQTGSGKTHTMFGPPGRGGDGPGATDRGLVPKIIEEVLEGLEARRAAGFDAALSVGFVEVFGSGVKNLLADGAAEGAAGNIDVNLGGYEEEVADWAAMASLLARGEENKRIASTAMNERSTRAHVLVILRLRLRAPDQREHVEATLSLVDLGGSERLSKSGANEGVRAMGWKSGEQDEPRPTWQEYYHGREKLQETANINTSLLALKRCIHALNERPRFAEAGKPVPRVPFRDSKLTLLLQRIFTGESRTSMVFCCSPEDQHADETVQSLRFGEMCSRVVAQRDGAPPDACAAVAQALQQLDAELKEVELEIRQKEVWEWRATTRTDLVSEIAAGGHVVADEVMELGGKGAVEFYKDDGTEKKQTVDHTVWGQVLVGAEAENARREELLRRRQRLLGGDAP